MLRYIFKRILIGVLVLWLIATLTFFLARAMPGGPFTREKALPEAILKNLNARYHLDDPLLKQYVDYIKNIARGDFGPSFRYPTQTVNDLIARGFPVSATIGLLALTLALLVGIPAGIISALRQNQWQDGFWLFTTTVLISVPNFIIATLLMYAFAYKLRWFPPALWGTAKQAVLPTIALAGYPLAFMTKLMRSSALEVMGQDYIRTCKAKGMPRYILLYRHMLKNAILPILTILGPTTASILMGGLVIEKIFAIPGLGQHLINGIFNRDYTVIMGLTIFYAFLLITATLLVDISYCLIDPRINLSGGTKDE